MRAKAVVPAYFHPAVDPEAWERLTGSAPALRLVVFNVADGPGDGPDPAYREAVLRLHARGVAVAGYVDTDYGRRDPEDVLTDVGRYLDWYAADGVFLDQVSSGADRLDHYASVTARSRSLGVGLVAFNHGTHPVEEYADHADLLGTFEGPWRSYVEVDGPRWVLSRPAELFFHLVYSVPRAHHRQACALAALRRAGGVYVTDHGGTNPWDYLPAGLLAHLGRPP